MLSAYVNASDMEGAEKFFKRLIQDGFEPNVVTYGTLIKGYAKINDIGKVMEKYEEMRRRSIKPNQTILTTIMDAHGKNGDFDSAVFWFKEMESSGVPPDQKAKNVLLSLAKTDEERIEASMLTGHSSENSNSHGVNGVVQFIGSDDDDDADDDYEEEDQFEYFDSQMTMACDEQSRKTIVDD